MVNSAGMGAADAPRAATDATERYERTVQQRFNGVSAAGLEFTIEEAS